MLVPILRKNHAANLNRNFNLIPIKGKSCKSLGSFGGEGQGFTPKVGTRRCT
jgi:hypothetical protein